MEFYAPGETAEMNAACAASQQRKDSDRISILVDKVIQLENRILSLEKLITSLAELTTHIAGGNAKTSHTEKPITWRDRHSGGNGGLV